MLDTFLNVFQKYMPTPAGDHFQNDVVSIDCETTGLNPMKDKILSIGAVKISGGNVLMSEKLNLFLDESETMTSDTIPIHQITPNMLKGGMKPDEAINKVEEFIGDAPVLGFNIGFDYSILNRYSKHYLGRPLKCRKLELQDIFLKHVPESVHKFISPNMDNISKILSTPVAPKHDALSDAVSVAFAYLAIKSKFP